MPLKENTGKLPSVSAADSKNLLIASILYRVIFPGFVLFYGCGPDNNKAKPVKELSGETGIKKDTIAYWLAPDINTILDTKQKELVNYGKELIAHTSKYLGPKGTVLKMSNGLNCQNCHLQSGTVIFGSNFGSVASLYPRFGPRSGTIENISKRVNDCFERSMNGRTLDSTGREMQSILSYINFIGSNVKKGKKAPGSGFKDLAFLNRAADPEKGKAIYIEKCQLCHQADGQGLFYPDHSEYIYPALWGEHSYNDGAGLYRIGNFAKFVKYNMPQGSTYQNPRLTDEEAWDVAAFVNSEPRPHMALPKDWPDIGKKPADHPFGPYADKFSEKQHKFGPFGPIQEEQKRKEAKPADKPNSK
jgi:thiosulfate dehydrogenase